MSGEMLRRFITEAVSFFLGKSGPREICSEDLATLSADLGKAQSEIELIN